VMMAGMMLPSLVPTLWRYLQVAQVANRWLPSGRTAALYSGLLTAVFAIGYLAVWAVLGLLLFPLGAAVCNLQMAEPVLAHTAMATTGVLVMMAGAMQFTSWKLQHLDCCRRTPIPAPRGTRLASAWHDGLRHGLHCNACCAPLTVILLVSGLMDRVVMALITVAITLERQGSDGRRWARIIGLLALFSGLLSFLPGATEP
jgi:predicted metal-binding membrane protein